jgi:aryl carrier-like protein
VPPVTDVDGQVRDALLARLAAGRSLGEDTNFFEAGLTSASLAELVAELRGHGVGVTLVDVFRYPTIRQLVDELARRAGRARPGQAGLPWD